jgi:uncharacterized membrane protein
MGCARTPWILTVLALVEFVADQLTSTPSCTVPMKFGAHIIIAAISGAAIGAPAGWLVIGGTAGIVGGDRHAGRACRADEAPRGLPQRRHSAFIEDAGAILAAIAVMMVPR